MDDDTCAVCLQIFFGPIRTSCGHTYCGSCWDRLAANATAEAQEIQCPTCRATVAIESIEPCPALEAEIRARHPEEWDSRQQLAMKEAADKLRVTAYYDAEARAQAEAE